MARNTSNSCLNENPKSKHYVLLIQVRNDAQPQCSPEWNGKASTTRLGMRWYRDAITFNSTENDETATFTIGAASIDTTPFYKAIATQLTKVKQVLLAFQYDIN